MALFTEDQLSAEIQEAALQATLHQAEAMTDDEALVWLRELDGRLWKRNSLWVPHATGPAAFERPRKPIKKSLSRSDWETFKVLARLFPSVPHNAWMHFGFGLTVFDFPVAPEAKLEFVCTVNTDHMGDEMLETLRKAIGMEDPKCQGDFRIGWELFSPLSHTERNREWHELYKLGGLHPRGYYDY